MLNRKGLVIIVVYTVIAWTLIMMFVGMLSCNSTKQAQRKWDTGIRKNETVFISNSQKLAKVYYKDFASFCAEYYPAITRNDSTEYLKAKAEYEQLKKHYMNERESTSKEIDRLNALYQSATLSGNDSLAKYALQQKINVLENQLSKCEASENKSLPPIIQQVADSALITAHRKISDTLTRRTLERDACEVRILQLEDEKKGKVMLPWWSLVIAGAVFAAGAILYIKK